MRPYRVIPIAMKFIADDVQCVHLLIGYFDTDGVAIFVNNGGHAETLLGRGVRK